MNQPQQANPNLIGAYLESQAKLRQIVNYGQLVSRFGLPPLDGAWAAHPLAAIFEVIDQQDAITNRPFRTALVVGVASGFPGGGFFEALERLKGVQDPRTQAAREALWVSELNATHNYPWP
jgi:hypothetical protein